MKTEIAVQFTSELHVVQGFTTILKYKCTYITSTWTVQTSTGILVLNCIFVEL